MVIDRMYLGSGAETSLLDLIIQTAPDAIITADSNGIILSFSPAAEQMFGYKADEVVGQNLSCLMLEQDRAHHDGYLQHYMRTGEKHVIGIGRQVRARRKSGEAFVAELAVGELRKGDDRIFTGFIRDVTERVDAIRKARRLQRALDQVSRIQMLGEMSTAVAHEINQPLTAISNFARAAGHRLRANPPDVQAAVGHLDELAEQALRAGEIVKRMKRMVDRGQANPGPENINAIVAEAVRIAKTVHSHDNLQVDMKLAADLPPVRADRIQIQQVVVNLLGNAVEAIEGEPPAEISISTRMAGRIGEIEIHAERQNHETIMVTVTDNGPGLPEELLKTAFDPFVSGHMQGVGVGLAVCRSIIQSHGGRIWAENNPGGGASVRFTLPVADS